MDWAKQTMMVFESSIWVWAGMFKAFFYFGRWGLMEKHFRPHQLHVSCMMKSSCLKGGDGMGMEWNRKV